MYQVKSRVIKNEEVAEGYFRLSLECPELAEKAVPGQFVMLRVGNSYDPLLRRPFSIHRIIKGSGIEILYKIIGKGTGMMAHIKAGEVPSLIGPLGNGFSINGEFGEVLVVGGGIGTAPLLALAEKLTGNGEGIGKERKVIVLLGGRSKDDILCVEEFKGLGAEVQVATDDGSLGHKGFVTELLDQYLGQPQGTAPTCIFSCGPHLMSKRVAGIAKKYNTPCQVSLEAHMACGVGACLGCVIKVRSSEFGVRNKTDLELNSRLLTPNSQLSCGCDSESVPCDTQLPESSFKRVCMEGPVFNAEDVLWD